ncbi:MAG: hypothetical protein OXK76_05375 [Gammaproteobacteria bacterium]|nr:hypothetical protein [Gammaproteobacteria bacterium]
MTLVSRPTRSLFPPFAGVALADILANSAAIVIIMIVVTLMASHEQEEEKLEQAEDVAVLLSRELATSFVMNALPTSPPARLHDYVTWGPDRNPQHALMPILELHHGFVRDFYTGSVYPREELLRYDNALDAYLDGLRAEQLAAIRIDVYSIREFYITMSILKAHGTFPRHWHFLSGAPGDARGGAGTFLAGRLRRDRAEPGLLDGETGTGTNPSSASTLPEDVALAGSIDSLTRYPLDDLGLAGRFSGSPPSEYLELPSTDAPGVPTSPFDIGTGARSAGDPTAQSADGSATTRFRVARVVGRESASGLTFDLLTALRGLYAFMKSAQADADAGRPSPLPDFDFERDILGRADEPLTPAEERLLGDLANELSVPVDEPLGTMTVVSRTDPELRGQALAVSANRPLYLAVWLRGPEQPPRTGEEETTVTLRLGMHPAIFEGLRIPLGQDGVILMPPPATVPDPEPRWRVVTLVNARVDDFVTGFVYAGVDATGRLLLPVDENAVEIGGLSVESRYPVVKFRGEFLSALLYGLVALLFAVGIVVGIRRRA